MTVKRVEEETELIDILLGYAASNEGAANSRHACAIVNKRGIVLGMGINSYKTSPLQVKYATNKFQIHLHSEIEALSRASRRGKGNLKGCSAYVVRINRAGGSALSKPCLGCTAALFAFGIGEVWHT